MFGVIEIPLTRGLAALVDDEDVALVGRHKWCAARNGQTWYAQRAIRHPDGRSSVPLMHAVITGFDRTDHINGDGLDNRRCNLRAATQSQNRMNTRKGAGKSSRFKGVTRTKLGRWQAQLRISGRQFYLGLYADDAEAALVYDAAARLRFGEFAALNFPRPGERSAHG